MIEEGTLKPETIPGNPQFTHLFRIVPRTNQGQATVDELLKQEVCLYFRICDMNWPLLDTKLGCYHEVTLQVYYKSGLALTNRTMIPLNQNLDAGQQ